MLIKCAGKVKKARGLSKLEQPVKVKLVFHALRQRQFSSRNEKWGVPPKRRCFDLDKALLAIRFERQNIIAKSVTFRLGNVLDSVCKSLLTQLEKTPMLEQNNKLFARQT